MRLARLIPVASAFLIACLPAVAHAAPRRPTTTPYLPVAVTLPARLNDPAFIALRKDLAAAAQRRTFDVLARYVRPQGFFWDRDAARRFDPKRTGAENLAAALQLESGAESGWPALADLAAESTVSELPGRQGVVCAPGQPKYVQHDFDSLIDATRTSPADWVFPRAPGVVLRLPAGRSGTAIETLGSVLVRVLRFRTLPANADPLRTAWGRVVAPNGNIGYAPPNSLVALSAPQLCYAKDVADRWVVAGFIGGN